MNLRSLALVALAVAGLSRAALAQDPGCAGGHLNGLNLYIGPGACQVPSGAQLQSEIATARANEAAERARALAAEAANATALAAEAATARAAEGANATSTNAETTSRVAALAAEAGTARAAESAAQATASAALPKAGGTMTGPLTLPGSPTTTLQAATKGYVDAETTRATAAEGTNAAATTAEATTARAAEGTNAAAITTETTSRIAAVAAEASTARAAESAALATANAALPTSGGVMTGPLVLSGAPTASLNPATKAYVDAETARATAAESAELSGRLSGDANNFNTAYNAQLSANAAQATANAALPKAGGTMTGPIVLPAAPTTTLQAATKGYVDAETTRATAAESANATGIVSEASTARAAESTNATAITNEAAMSRNAGNLSAGSVPAARLINLASIAPTTTSITTSPATVFPAGSYLSIRIAPMTAGSQVACTGDGTTPTIGSSPLAFYGQTLFWPIQPGGAMPAAAVRCVGNLALAIQAEAH